MTDEMPSLEWLEARLEGVQQSLKDPRLSESVDKLRDMEARARQLQQLLALCVLHYVLEPFWTPNSVVENVQMKIVELVGDELRRSPENSAENLAKDFMACHYAGLAGRERVLVEEHYVKLFQQAQHPQ